MITPLYIPNGFPWLQSGAIWISQPSTACFMWPWVKIQIVPPVNIPTPPQKKAGPHQKWDGENSLTENPKVGSPKTVFGPPDIHFTPLARSSHRPSGSSLAALARARRLALRLAISGPQPLSDPGRSRLRNRSETSKRANGKRPFLTHF